ncbi:MAG: NUDIX domain-containing protein [Parachlamydiaceae bacterium]|nr:NUDIX domain-containing protein [Parachlamydiaceae bacterium]
MKKSVSTIIFDEKRQSVLLIKRRDVAAWVLPGGGVDENETSDAAAVREAFEETGLQVAIIRKVAEYTPLNKLAHFTSLYECKQTGGKLSTGSETRDLAFFPIKNLPKKFFFIHEDWLADALLESPDVISKPLSKVTYFAFVRYLLCHPFDTIRFALSRLGFPINSG